MRRPDVPALRIAVGGRVDPHLLAAALRARLSGRPWSAGPEAEAARAVAEAAGSARRARGHRSQEGRSWS